LFSLFFLRSRQIFFSVWGVTKLPNQPEKKSTWISLSAPCGYPENVFLPFQAQQQKEELYLSIIESHIAVRTSQVTNCFEAECKQEAKSPKLRPVPCVAVRSAIVLVVD
jgi:hypothetical protein